MVDCTTHYAYRMCSDNWRNRGDALGCDVQEVERTRQGGKGEERRGGQIGGERGVKHTGGTSTMTERCVLPGLLGWL